MALHRHLRTSLHHHQISPAVIKKDAIFVEFCYVVFEAIGHGHARQCRMLCKQSMRKSRGLLYDIEILFCSPNDQLAKQKFSLAKFSRYNTVASNNSGSIQSIPLHLCQARSINTLKPTPYTIATDTSEKKNMFRDVGMACPLLGHIPTL